MSDAAAGKEDDEVDTGKFFCTTWKGIVKEFEERYDNYYVHDRTAVHTVCTDESPSGEWEVWVRGYDQNIDEYRKVVAVCASKEIAVEEAVALLWHDSDGPFFETDLIFGPEMEKFAKANDKTEQLAAMQNKVRALVLCKHCFEPERWIDKFHSQNGSHRLFVKPRPPVTVVKKRRIGYEDATGGEAAKK